MAVILLEDELVEQLFPVTLARPAFNITCGSYHLEELVRRLKLPVAAVVRSYLHELYRSDHPAHVPVDQLPGGTRLLINARLAPSVDALQKLQQLWNAREPVVCIRRDSEQIIAALLPGGVPLPTRGPGSRPLASQLAATGLATLELDLPLLEYPHDVVRYHMTSIRANLEDRIAHGDYIEHADGVYLGHGAELGPYCVTDTSRGPIVLEVGSQIGPYTFLSGPVHVGRAARVIAHSALKDCVAIGHTTKIGGEVEGSVIEPYTNKQHHGFLGHSYLGSWINLGAGTCNSDLKNTYGKVNMDYGGRRVPTDMQFIGCIAGDYSKSAINTGIFTGKTIGVCSMIYGFVTTNVPSFVNYARSFGQVTEAPVEVMIATQARMFLRRQVTQRPCDVQLLRDMYELTRHERQMAGEPLVL